MASFFGKILLPFVSRQCKIKNNDNYHCLSLIIYHRSLSHVWPATGTPALATLTSGLCAAFAALLIQLEVLVEMMSIGEISNYYYLSHNFMHICIYCTCLFVFFNKNNVFNILNTGTLLAYTLVSTCVLILRYQPHTTNLVELLPQSLRTPCRSPTKETQGNGQVTYGKELRPDQLTTALNTAQVAQPELLTTNNGQRIMVRYICTYLYYY